MKVFLDTSILLTAFGTARNTDKNSFILTTKKANKITFEKCIFESFLAFRGIGGKKPDEGRNDWANRYLKKENDPIPLGDASGKLHSGCISNAHFFTGHAEELMYTISSSSKFKDYINLEEWNNFQGIIKNHLRYKELFEEFKFFLKNHDVSVISYEEIYKKSNQSLRSMIMKGLSERSTIPNEDFEIIYAALLLEPDLFITTDRRLLKATQSIELNLRRFSFIHLNDAEKYISQGSQKGSEPFTPEPF